MTTFFDLCATGLFVAVAGLFLYRLKYEDPPLMPYVVCVAACALGNWAGNEGSAAAGSIILAAVGFLLMHMAGEPFQEDDNQA
ncbi:MAG: hypothetical protein MRY59_07550 [Aquisalinus sp.]|nr:hypothetical protein [Aquisalinus sp.]